MKHAPILDPPWAMASSASHKAKPPIEGHLGRDDEPTLKTELDADEREPAEARPTAPPDHQG
jgi:hypothetical protein